MAKGNFTSGMQGFMALHTKFSEQDHAERARRQAHERQSYMDRARATGLLGDSRLADTVDIAAADMHNTQGLFLGAYKGRMLFFNGEGPLLTYLRTGGGKGVCYLLTNLAHSRDRSLIVVDVKDGQNLFASGAHREALGQKVIVLDPFGISGCPNVRINPLQRLIDIIERGEEIDTQADEIAQILLPANPKDGENSWVRKGALRLLALRMEYLVRFEPELCTLSGLWCFVNSGREDLDIAFAMMKTCGNDGIEQRAHSLHTTMQDAERQWEAYKSDCIEAVAPFEPGKTFARATEKNELDFGRLKHEKHTVYIVVPSEKIGVAAPWISLIINHAIEEIAKETGPLWTTFFLDEFPQLPPAPAIMKALRLYRGKNIQLFFFAQGRYSMRARWSEDSVKEFEDQAAVMTFGYVQDRDLVRDIGVWSGTASVLLKNDSYSGGAVEAANSGLNESKRDLLQPEDIYRSTIDGRQIIKIRTLPYLLVADVVPYYTVNPWKYQIRDVRGLHSGTASP